ncbi:hypothetical protein [Oscillibacter sp.]|uniref:hypothetical protein n=1 Tax=Oscillibacter sp. TaxID=1945593 RepID=UPI0026170096|nr:hypothetical protein [Oscillibacter sp.]MDD3347310.1 hypothetical protein [Oscillibacter sp.]
MKKNVLFSRRRTALRRILRTLVCLLLVQHILGVGLLLPRQAIRQVEQRSGVTGTRVVARRWMPKLYATHLLYLTENEAATQLCDTHWTIFGWEGGFGWTLDCTTGEPLYIAERSMSRSDETLWYYYGRVDNVRIADISVSVQAEEFADGKSVSREVDRFTAAKGDWLTKEGRRYFLLRQADGTWPYEQERRRAFAVALDAEGKELFRQEIEQGTFSYY